MPVLCYITDRRAFAGDESARRLRLLEKIAEAARCGVDYIQLREKDLSGRELESLAREAVKTVRENTQLRTEKQALRTALLINSRTDVASAAGANGVHLRSDDVSPQAVREIWECAASSMRGVSAHSASSGTASTRENSPCVPMISVSCHSPAQVVQAAADGADFAIFAPVFEKKDSPSTNPAGLALLRYACQAKIPVLALGGITLSNAQSCLEAGAAGIAAIRLFQDNDIAEVVRELRR